VETREWLPAGRWSGGTPCTDPSGAGNEAAAKEAAVPPLSGGDSEATHATHSATIERIINAELLGRIVDYYLRHVQGIFQERPEQRKVPLADVWTTRFEYVRPVREFPSYSGRRGFSGQWWSSTLRDLVGSSPRLVSDQASAR
jgi:hypothetical protein